MTKREKLIGMLAEGIASVDRKTIETIFEIYNDYDWKVFCSYMGDYDHPGERVAAEKEMNEKFDKLAGESPEVAEAIKYVVGSLTTFENPIRNYYHENFHTLNEEA